jgi:hypothetical protein
MQLNVAVHGVGGDASLSFAKEHIRVRWKEATFKERRMVGALVKRGRKLQMEVCTVDADGKPDKPAYSKDLPGLFKNAQGGELILQQGEKDAIKTIAKELIEDEIEVGGLVMEAQADGTWRLLKKGEFKPEPEKKQEVQVSRPVRGG